MELFNHLKHEVTNSGHHHNLILVAGRCQRL